MITKYTKFRDIPQLIIAPYRVDCSFDGLRRYTDEYELDLNPDFQRYYVWTEKQKTEYIEWVLRGGKSGRDLYFNHPGWMNNFKGDFVVVDGKQRLSAVFDFLDNKIKAYGSFLSEYEDRLNFMTASLSVNIANLKTRKEVLQWYIQLNTGGTAHTDDELEKVRELLKKEDSNHLK